MSPLHYKRADDGGNVLVRREDWEADRYETLDSRSFEQLKQFSRTFGLPLIDDDLEADLARNKAAETPPA